MTCTIYILAPFQISREGVRLHEIKNPVFVMGGKQDQIVTGKASEEIAEKLDCPIYMYEDLGHSAYEEAADFNKRIFDFLRGK